MENYNDSHLVQQYKRFWNFFILIITLWPQANTSIQIQALHNFSLKLQFNQPTKPDNIK